MADDVETARSEARKLMASNPNFTIQPGKLEGTLGGCSYGMTAEMGEVYVGSMTCGGVPIRANLQLPPSLAMYYPAEIAAHLAVFLAR